MLNYSYICITNLKRKIMKWLSISNDGLIQVEALTLLGASTKKGQNGKIGMFGSGNKYALAYLLRNNYNVKIYSGLEEIKLTTAKKQFRNDSFEVVCVNGKETSITTDFGKDWELWQAIRELYCNSIDEGNESIEFVNEIQPNSSQTKFYIETNAQLFEFISNFEKYFSGTRKVLFECKYGAILEKGQGDFNLFRRGIRCMESNKKSVYDYELSDVRIGENRLVSWSWEIPSNIWNLIYRCTDKKVIKDILMNCSESDYIECISSDYASISVNAMSEEYLEVMEEFSVAPKGLSGLLTIQEQASTVILPTYIFNQVKPRLENENLASKFKMYKEELFRIIDMDDLQEATVNKARDFFKVCKMENYLKFEINAAIFENKKVLGMAYKDEQIVLISELALGKGVQTVIETIIEEYIHLEYDVRDETRGFQDAAIREIVTILKKNNTYLT